MPGQTDEISFAIHYKDADLATGTWIPFLPVGGIPITFEMSDGRPVDVASTVAGTYRCVWEVDSISEFQWFDRLREGLPIRFAVTHTTHGTVFFAGWVSEPAIEDPVARTVTIVATDGVGRVQVIDRGDWVESMIRSSWSQVTHYWPLDDADQTARAKIVTVADATPNGVYVRDVSQSLTTALRAPLENAHNLDIPEGASDYQGQQISFGTWTGVDQGTDHVLAANIKVVDDDTGAVRRNIFGFSQFATVPYAGNASPLTVGVYQTDDEIEIRSLDGANTQIIHLTFTPTLNEVYTIVLSYEVVSATQYRVRYRVVDDGGNMLHTGSNLESRGVGTFATLSCGPAPAIVQDLVLMEGDVLYNAGSDSFAYDLAGYAGSTTSQRFEKVLDSAGLAYTNYSPDHRGLLPPEPIGGLEPVGGWLRRAETMEQGAIYWNGVEFEFDTLSILQAKVSALSLASGGDIPLFTASARSWAKTRNNVTVSGPDAEYVLSNSASETEHGQRSATIDVDTDDYTLQSTTAGRFLDLHQWPRRHHPELVVDMAASGLWEALFDVGLFDKVTVTWPDDSVSSPHITGRFLRLATGVDVALLQYTLTDLVPVTGSAPSMTAAPSVTGTVEVGQTLTAASEGTWANTPTRKTGQWQASPDAGVTVFNIGGDGGMDTTLKLDARHDGLSIRRRVGAWNGAGPTVYGYSGWTVPVGSGAGSTPDAPTGVGLVPDPPTNVSVTA